ncbi:unnamed protein product, partial [Didymodactylos carnosus]
IHSFPDPNHIQYNARVQRVNLNTNRLTQVKAKTKPYNPEAGLDWWKTTKCKIVTFCIFGALLVLTGILVPTLLGLFSKTPATTPIIQIFWPFDGNTNDFYGTYNGTTVNSPTYFSAGITGYGSAINLVAASSQSIVVSTYLNLASTSFTVETWLYPTTTPSGDNAIFGQCACTTCTDQCMYLVLRSGVLYMGFYGDNLAGVTSISANKWWHVAFVFDNSASTQTIYVNGVQDATRTSNSYKGTSGGLTLGTSAILTPNNYFNGYFDQMAFISKARNASELLDAATLTVYYTFDTLTSGNYSFDSGPNLINGTGVGVTSASSGRVNQALQFSTSGAYFQVGGLILLATVNNPYSVSVWVKPTSLAGGSIIQWSSANTGSGWCIG